MLSPMLFNIALEEVVRKVLNIGIDIKLQQSKTTKLISYVDDIVIIDYTKKNSKIPSK